MKHNRLLVKGEKTFVAYKVERDMPSRGGGKYGNNLELEMGKKVSNYDRPTWILSPPSRTGAWGAEFEREGQRETDRWAQRARRLVRERPRFLFQQGRSGIEQTKAKKSRAKGQKTKKGGKEITY